MQTVRSHRPIWKASTSLVEEKIGAITTWVQDCESKHGSRCMPTALKMPKRLIDVGTEHRAPCVVLAEGTLSKTQRYVTLSHCWGDALPIRLLSSNIDRYKYEIPSDIVPPSFQDATAITKALGISYLWIDALCILQDSSEEWAKEAVKMKDIYAGSFLNIAASDAASSLEGCFLNHRSDEGREVGQFDVQESDWAAALSVRIQKGDLREATQNTVLSTRGWVLQEQLLSRRTISCMYPELYWQCMGITETESGAQFEQTGSAISRLKEYCPDLAHDRVWRSWIHEYSKRNFTFWEDKLPALSGIVQYYQEVTGDIPLLGIWKSSFLQDLLWIRAGLPSVAPLQELQTMNLPTWSWIACPAVVDFDIWRITMRTNQVDPLVIVEDHCNLIRCNVEWTGLPFTSKVTEAYLLLEGPTVDFSVKACTSSKFSYPSHFGIIFGDTRIDSDEVSSTFTAELDLTEGMEVGVYTALLLRSREHEQTRSRREIFLILEQIDGSMEHSTYRRLGIACFMGKNLRFGKAHRKRLVLL